MENLVSHGENINALLARYGVKFGIYKNGVFHEQLFPYDAIPRVIPADEFAKLKKGLIQRVDALNLYLADIYSGQQIVKDGVVPADFAFSSSGYLPQCADVRPPRGVYSHISGIDLVQDESGEWFILEDNLRIPSGASYPMIARELSRIASPQSYRLNSAVDNRRYGQMLRETMDAVNCGGINVILTPGRFNAAYFEHSYLREVPQVRINEKTEQTLVPLARRLNVDYIWGHANATVLESTLAYSLNEAGVPTLVVEMGIGLRLTPAYCEQLADGLIARVLGGADA